MPTGQRTVIWTPETDQRLVQALVYYGHISTLSEDEAQRVADFVGEGKTFPGASVKSHFNKIKSRLSKELGTTSPLSKKSKIAKRGAAKSGTGARKKMKAKHEEEDDLQDPEDNVGSFDNAPSTPTQRRSSERQSPKKDYRGMDDPYANAIPDKIADRLFATCGEDDSSSNDFRPDNEEVPGDSD